MSLVFSSEVVLARSEYACRPDCTSCRPQGCSRPYMLETRLQNKIKSADNEVNEAVERAVAQSPIEKDGIEIV